MLLCTVRDCHLPLARDGRRLMCSGRHSFDVARSGYINLLQPQDRRSKKPGDSADAVAARRRLHDRGITKPLMVAIGGMMAATAADVVLDVGCGDGFYLSSLARELGIEAHGVDISIPAVDAAARRYPSAEWVVANADRGLPYSNDSFDILLSITGRMNPNEFHRVLKSGGRLLIALAASDDIIELRGQGRDRVDRTVNEFATHFDVIAKSQATTIADLDASSVEDVLTAIYRPMGSRPIEAMRVTFSLDLLLFKVRSDNPRREP